MVKLVALLKRNPSLSQEEFYAHWENHHGPTIANTPELAKHIIRYEQLRATQHASWMHTEGYDGITIQWMESAASLEAFIAEPKYAELIAPDEAYMLDGTGMVWMITEEPTVAIDGPAS
jgi:hypothetical protein